MKKTIRIEKLGFCNLFKKGVLSIPKNKVSHEIKRVIFNKMYYNVSMMIPIFLKRFFFPVSSYVYESYSHPWTIPYCLVFMSYSQLIIWPKTRSGYFASIIGFFMRESFFPTATSSWQNCDSLRTGYTPPPSK